MCKYLPYFRVSQIDSIPFSTIALLKPLFALSPLFVYSPLVGPSTKVLPLLGRHKRLTLTSKLADVPTIPSPLAKFLIFPRLL